MTIYETDIAGRRFINFGDTVAIPIDRIRKFDFTVANGGASDRSVRVLTDDPDEEIIFAFENRDAVLAYLRSKALLNV